MKVLILCDMFPPAFAPRMGYLCKYMKRAGWQPVVVTEYIPENMFAFLTRLVPVTYIKYFHSHHPIWRKVEWLAIFLLDFFFHYKDRKMAKVADSLLREQSFDTVLCSTYRTFPLPAALRVAKKHRLPLIADLRDIIEQYAANEYISKPFHTFPWLDKLITRAFRRHLLSNRNRVLREAACITTVSPWHVETLRPYNPHIRLIYNGYDPELFYPEHFKTDRFLLTYTGRILSFGIRDPRPLLEAVRRLDEEKKIVPEKFCLVWYIDEHSRRLMEHEATVYQVGKYMEYHPYVGADQIPNILHHSSILLQLANKCDEKGPKGIMSTKLFEAMATEKPLLCVRSDESCLEQTIRETRTGTSARTADEAYRFILEQYQRWEKQGFTFVEPNRPAVERFSRSKQAEQFMQLISDVKVSAKNVSHE